MKLIVYVQYVGVTAQKLHVTQKAVQRSIATMQ